MVNAAKYEKELVRLRDEHVTLESEITSMLKSKVVNSFAVQALKKKKLAIKQAISQLESMLIGDIVA